MENVSFINILEKNDALPDAQLYLFIDVKTQTQFWQRWEIQLQSHKKEWCFYYDLTPFSHLKDVSPIVVKLKDGNVGNDILQTLTTERWGFIASTPFSLETISDHFRRWLTAFFPNGHEHLFRWYSPKVLQTCLTSTEFDDEDKRLLVHPYYSLYCPHSDGQYHELYTQSTVLASQSLLPANGWFHIEQEFLDEINALYYQSALAEMAIELFKTVPVVCMGLEYSQVIKGLDDGLIRAAKYRRTTAHVRKMFAFYRFIFGSHFWELSEFVSKVKMGSLSDALYELYHRPDWQAEVIKKHHDKGWLQQLERSH